MFCASCGQTLENDQWPCGHCGYDRQVESAVADLRFMMLQSLETMQSITRQADQLTRVLHELLQERRTQTYGRVAPLAVPPKESTAKEKAVAPVVHTATKPPVVGESFSRPVHSPSEPTKPREVSTPPPTVMPDTASRLDKEINLGQKWMLGAGVLAVLFGIAYFLKWSFDRNLIPPFARVGLAYGAGAIALGVGKTALDRGYARFGHYLIGGGFTSLYVATGAGVQIYHLIPPYVAIGLMLATTAGVGITAYRLDTLALAILGLVGGFAAPVVLGIAGKDEIVLMTYLLILNGGVLGLAAARHWHSLNLLGWCSTWVIFLGWMAADYSLEKFWPTLAFLHAFFLVYAIVPVSGPLRHRTAPIHNYGLLLSLANAIVPFVIAFNLIQKKHSLESVAYAAVGNGTFYLAMAARMHRKAAEIARNATVLMLALGSAYYALAVPLYFDAYVITDFWAILGLAICWLSLRLHHKGLAVGGLLLVLMAVGRLYMVDYATDWRLHPFSFDWSARWLTNGIVLGAMLAMARFTRQVRGTPMEGALLDKAWPFAFGLGLFLTSSFETSAFFEEFAPSAHFAAISVLWAFYSIGLIVLGFRWRNPVARKFALSLFAITLVKVFLSDMANTSTPFRIISLIVVGLLLIGASWLYYRYKDRLLGETEKGEETPVTPNPCKG